MQKRRFPSPAVLLGALALFVALGGTATAVSQFGSGAIKDGSIRSRDIHNGAITKADLDNRAEQAIRGFKNLETDGPYLAPRVRLRAKDDRCGDGRPGPQSGEGVDVRRGVDGLPGPGAPRSAGSDVGANAPEASQAA